MRRGAYLTFVCGTKYCDGVEGRCLLCGGAYSECRCGVSDFDACLCGARATEWRRVRPIHLVRLLAGLARELWCAIRYRDTWWLLHGWRGDVG
jgi:hypothetical protein